jgi:L,D-transpeptidase YcbB
MKKVLAFIFILVCILLAIRAYATPLSDALIKYEQIAENGGWNRVVSTTKIQLGDQDSRVISLWSRLYISGDITEDYSGKFDRALEKAVKKFQIRHGLKVDGIAGKETLQELNISVKERIKQIKLNIDKVEFKDGFIVNIPDFKLYIVENGETINSFKVIVGKKKNQTPRLSAKIQYLEFNPYWNVPHKIAKKELLPIIKKNPEYLKKENISVFENWSERARELHKINWNYITKYNFHYKLRQNPGKKNVLGAVKFIFPNPYSVYLHDTDKKYLFDKQVRAFSHGCVRVDNPMKIALYVVMNNINKELSEVTDIVASESRKIVRLDKPIDIHIVYWTSWVDANGVNFRKDIYRLDNEETRFARH